MGAGRSYVLAIVIVIGLLALACGRLVSQVVQQIGRMLLRIEAMEQSL